MPTTTTPRPPARTRPPAPPGGPGAPVDLGVRGLVAATPATRDRTVDVVRALSIVVVVLWHWVFSVTQWSDDGALVMPNPLGEVPGLWLASWVLQIMPVFFVVGGFANLASFEAAEHRGGGAREFLRGRARRLGRPVAVYLAIWVVGDLAARVLVPSYPGVTHWGMVVFVPLWFLGVYAGVVLAAPLTIRLHRAGGARVVVALGVLVLAADLARFHLGVEAIGLVTSAGVWLLAHQLGYLWRDGTLTAGSDRRRAALALGGLAALVALVVIGPYPASMVSRPGEGSNLYPTTACIAALAVFQTGLVLLARPHLERWFARRRPWTVTVAVNAVAMTVFTWHMTALVGAIGLYQLLGYQLGERADAGWWWQRPLWLVLPGLLLAALLVAFARFELPGGGRRRAQRRRCTETA